MSDLNEYIKYEENSNWFGIYDYYEQDEICSKKRHKRYLKVENICIEKEKARLKYQMDKGKVIEYTHQ